MPTEVIVALVTLGGVMASVAVSYLLNQRQMHAQLDNLRYQVEQGFTEKLYEKRLEAYPLLYTIISGFAKQGLAGPISKKALDEFGEALNAWDSHYAIFCSAFTSYQMLNLRRAIRRFERAGQGISKTKMGKEITPLLFEVELAMKTELGVFASEGYHSPTQVRQGPHRPLKETIDDLRQASTEEQ